MELQQYLSQSYQGAQSFIGNVLSPIFRDNIFSQNYDVLRYQDEYSNLAKETGIDRIVLVAEIEPEDSINKISVFDITVSDRIRLQRNRVGIQRLVSRLVEKYDGAFMLFHYSNAVDYDWRFTYTFKGLKQSDEANLRQTDNKRYTCLLGPNQSCRTAADNFGALIKLNGKVTIEDIRQAFDVEALSKEFFNRYRDCYADIVEYVTGKRYIKQNGAWVEKQTCEPADVLKNFADFSDPDKAVRDCVKKLMGRLVFLCFLQKKGWLGVSKGEDWGTGDVLFLQHLWEDHGKPITFIDDVLEPLFEDLNSKRLNDIANDRVIGESRIPYLNGGLFEKDDADQVLFPLPSKYLQNLFDLFSQYNFTIDENDPNDIQVGIDPEMLGKIFESQLEDNKDKGAFYTPKEIVQYMCRESLMSYLAEETHIDSETIRNFVTEHTIDYFTQKQTGDVLRALKNVKICDPAIGSGAFPMGLLRELYFCRSILEKDNSRNTAAHIKREIIQNSIYGVDIEKGAIDIARLRFWLALVVDLEEPEALPNLDFKIMQGNSLLEQYQGFDLSNLSAVQKSSEPERDLFGNYVGGGQLNITYTSASSTETINDLTQRYFRETDHVSKVSLRNEINRHIANIIGYNIDIRISLCNSQIVDANSRINNLQDKIDNWKRQSITVFAKEIDKAEKNIDRELKFIENTQEQVQSYLKIKSELFDGNYDISQNTDFFLWHTWFSDVFNRPSKQGFDIVIGNPPYVLIDKSIFTKDYSRDYLYQEGKIDLYRLFIEKSIGLTRDKGVISFITPNTFLSIKNCTKLRKFLLSENSFMFIDSYDESIFEASVNNVIYLLLKGIHLDNININIHNSNSIKSYKLSVNNVLDDPTYQVMINADQDAFSIREHMTKHAILLDKIDGIEMCLGAQPYHNTIHTKEQMDQKFLHADYKVNNNYVQDFGGKHFSRYVVDGHPKRWIDYSAEFYTKPDKRFFEGPRIVIREIPAKTLVCAYVETFALFNKSVFNIRLSKESVNIKYLIAVLNSLAIGYYISAFGDKSNQNLFPRISMKILKNLPIPEAAPAQQKPIIDLVDTILTKKKQNPQADTSDEENAIDKLVYQLYGLTDGEINLIEK